MVPTGDEVLRRRPEFRQLYDHGNSLRSSSVVLVYERTDAQGFRGAVVASRKVGKAVRRNRAKRWLREAHRTLRPACRLDGVRLVLIARRSTPDAGFHRIQSDLVRLYQSAGFLEGPSRA